MYNSLLQNIFLFLGSFSFMFILADIFHNAVVIPQVVFAYYCYVCEAVFVLFLVICDDMKV